MTNTCFAAPSFFCSSIPSTLTSHLHPSPLWLFFCLASCQLFISDFRILFCIQGGEEREKKRNENVASKPSIFCCVLRLAPLLLLLLLLLTLLMLINGSAAKYAIKHDPHTRTPQYTHPSDTDTHTHIIHKRIVMATRRAANSSDVQPHVTWLVTYCTHTRKHTDTRAQTTHTIPYNGHRLAFASARNINLALSMQNVD